MDIKFRPAIREDLDRLKNLAVKSWSKFQENLTPENWDKLRHTLSDDKTWSTVLSNSDSFIATTHDDRVIGMAFLTPSGHPTEIFDKDWACIRFLTVDPDFGGQGIGRKLTMLCIERARLNNEKAIALHTSEIMNRARHIYESLGFTIFKELDRRLGIRYWLYKLDL
ncbi:MAG TPA: GNAT family N-acetyltransferase [Flavihumibacter sp.]